MGKAKKELSQQEIEQDFKNAVADIFIKKVPGAYLEKDSGLIVIPRQRRKKPDSIEKK